MDPQIAEIGNPRESLPRDEHAVSSLNGIAEQDQRTDEAQPPEGLRDNHPPLALGGIPLHEESAEKNGARNAAAAGYAEGRLAEAFKIINTN